MERGNLRLVRKEERHGEKHVGKPPNEISVALQQARLWAKELEEAMRFIERGDADLKHRNAFIELVDKFHGNMNRIKRWLNETDAERNAFYAAKEQHKRHG